MYSIQLATLSGLQVIATASPKNTEFLISLGAKYVVDYSSPSATEEIQKITNGKLRYVLDCVSKGNSARQATIPATENAILALVLPIDEKTLTKPVKISLPVLYTISGKDVQFGPYFLPASQEDKRWGEEWAGKLSKVVREGKIRTTPVKVIGGLDDVEKGFKYMSEGKVHAEKLVYEIDRE